MDLVEQITLHEASAFDGFIRNLTSQTQNNNHTVAMVVAAKYFKDRKLVKVLEAINTIQDDQGGLSPQVSSLREFYRKRLDKLAKQKLSADEYELYHGAF